jgi:transcription initiation factor TFIIH subunit 3
MMSEWRFSISKAKQHQSAPVNFEPLISGALSIALCKINRKKEQFDSSRVVIITPSSDHPFFLTSQYMSFMNAFFTAQKMDVVIDVATANNEAEDSSNSILRQACDITQGTYLRIPNQKALLQYLNWVLLPDFETRKSLVLPEKVPVGSRAACFCHRTLVEIGYVCSVCLSVFCTFSPICTTCNTIFKLGTLPSPTKKQKMG